MDFLRPGKLTSANERGSTTPAKVYFDKAGEGSAADWETYFKDQYESTVGKGYTSLPTGNHDEPRIANQVRHDPAELETLLTFILTQPGIPFIYYGDELGMKYVANSPDVEGSRNRSGSRTPMQWDDSLNAGFSTSSQDRLYIPLDPDPNRPTVAKEEKDPGSQLNYVRGLLRLRKSSEALGNDGGLEFLSDTAQSYPLVYLRRSGKERFVIAINPTNKAVEAKIASQNASRASYAFGTTEASSYKTGKGIDIVQMPPVSAVVFRLE